MRNPLRNHAADDRSDEVDRSDPMVDPPRPMSAGSSGADLDPDTEPREGPRHARPVEVNEALDRPRSGRVHLDTAREAGFGRVSGLSILSGTMCAYGAFAVVAAVAGALLTNTDLETDFRTNDWTSTGAAAGLVTALVLLAAYLFGGYVAGRMARRSGMLHGLGVFVLSLVVGLLVGTAASVADGVEVSANLRSIGVPTEWDQVESVGVAAAIASLAAMLIGSVVGGALGERWHAKLASRFEDPAYGPAAEARARAEREDRAHRERLQADPVMAGERHTDTAREPLPASGSPMAVGQDQPIGSDPSRRGSIDDMYDDRRSDRSPETIDLRTPPPPPPPPPAPATAPVEENVESGRRSF